MECYSCFFLSVTLPGRAHIERSSTTKDTKMATKKIQDWRLNIKTGPATATPRHTHTPDAISSAARAPPPPLEKKPSLRHYVVQNNFLMARMLLTLFNHPLVPFATTASLLAESILSLASSSATGRLGSLGLVSGTGIPSTRSMRVGAFLVGRGGGGLKSGRPQLYTWVSKWEF